MEKGYAIAKTTALLGLTCLVALERAAAPEEGVAGGERLPTPVVTRPTNLEHSSDVKAIFCRCIDQRFEEVAIEFENHEWDGEKRDPFIRVGGVRWLASDDVQAIPTEALDIENGVKLELIPRFTKDVVLALGLLYEVHVAIRLHHPKEIVDSIHEDCGAYSGKMPKRDPTSSGVDKVDLFLASENRKASLTLGRFLKYKGHKTPSRFVSFTAHGADQIPQKPNTE